jgi:2-iminobutanoate/2-iminopropanoate deaminase
MRTPAAALTLLAVVTTAAAAASPDSRHIRIARTGPTDASGHVVAGDVRAQTARALDNLSAKLAARGCRMEQVAAVTVALRSEADFAAMNEVYATYWPDKPPTRTTIVAKPAEPGALLELTAVALPDGAERRVVLPEGWLRPASPYSYAIQSGDTLFLSGLLSRNGRDNSIVPGDIKTQTGQILRNAVELLKAAGMTTDDVESARVYVPSTAMVRQMESAWREAFGTRVPPRTVVRSRLVAPEALVEIMLTAAKR